MHSTALLLLSVAALASAQSFATGGQGRFPCGSTVNGQLVLDDTDCNAQNIQRALTPECSPVSGETVDGGGFKSYGAIPTGDVKCFPASAGGGAFCGIAGAACTTNDQCDNGACTAGICTGGLGAPCTLDSECTGTIYCLNPSGGATGTNVCGGSQATDSTGAYCDDTCGAGNFLCVSNICDGKTGTCFPVTAAGQASQRARARRDNISPRGSRCPASHTACPVSGLAKGYECIDTTSNLEQCGACATQGGVDCTALPGVDAVGCVAGQCEIWACAESHVWDAASGSCQLALVA